MANIDTPQGGQYSKYQSGSASTGGTTDYFVPSSDGTALFIGDPVTIQGASNTAIQRGIGTTAQIGSLPTVIKSGVTGAVTGFVQGFVATSEDSPTSRLASTDRVVRVYDDPDAIFVIQGDSATAAAGGDVSNNADMVFTHAGLTRSGLSGVELDVSSITTSDTLQLKIVGFLDDSSNDTTAVNAKYLVKINNHTQAPNTAGV